MLFVTRGCDGSRRVHDARVIVDSLKIQAEPLVQGLGASRGLPAEIYCDAKDRGSEQFCPWLREEDYMRSVPRKRHLLIMGVCTAAIGAGSSSAFAQSSSGGNVIEELVVTAEKREQSL